MVKREDLKKLESNDKSRYLWNCGESSCDSGEIATNPRNSVHLAITAVSVAAQLGKALNVPYLRNIRSSTISGLATSGHRVLEDRRRSEAQSTNDDGGSDGGGGVFDL
jgi:hypothetical protein